MKPITLGYEWNKKFANVGWQPNNFQSIAGGILGNVSGESIMGLIKTGDSVGELLEVRQSVAKENGRKVETLVGFTTGQWDNSLPNHELIPPERRIQGYLVITSKRFVIQGRNKCEINFDDLVSSSSSGDAQEGANIQIKRLGFKGYRFGGDVSIGWYATKKQNSPNNVSPDSFFIAILYNERNIFSFINGINNDVFHTWNSLSSFLHSSLF